MATSSAPEKVAAILERRHLDRGGSGITREMELNHFIALANEARRSYEDAAAEYARYVTQEGEMEANRHFVKYEATCRIMEDQKVSATKAEEMARSDAMYLDHLEAQRGIVAKKNAACTRMVSARLRCETSIAAMKALSGLI